MPDRAGEREEKLSQSLLWGQLAWPRSAESSVQCCHGLHGKTGQGGRGARLPHGLQACLPAWKCCWLPGRYRQQGAWPQCLLKLGSGGTPKSCCRSTEQSKKTLATCNPKVQCSLVPRLRAVHTQSQTRVPAPGSRDPHLLPALRKLPWGLTKPNGRDQ